MMFSVNSSLSALMAYGKKMAVHADNVSNVYSEDYKKSRAIINQGPDRNVTAEIEKIDSMSPPVQETNNRAALENEPDDLNRTMARSDSVKKSNNVELNDEFVGIGIAQKGYEANIKVIEAQNEMIGTILDLLS